MTTLAYDVRPAAVRHSAGRALRRRPPRAASVARSRAGADHALRLTRRGRIVVVVLIAAIAFLAFSLGRASTSQASRPGAPAPARHTTVVRQGDTLWQIAQRVAPDNDPRAVVGALRELNGLDASPLRAGQRLVLPR
ncbi:MAG: LysM peptidoglycan-binding domain-containing protein [Mycobacteriales bacterium]|nr:LysM peptidoglycan-binding domain-containing protein [Frankia sp.]